MAFTFDVLETNTYDLRFEADGYEDLETSWSTDDGAMTVRVEARSQAVAATVQDSSGAGVSGASVTAEDANGNTWTATTDSSGDASFDLPTGVYAFTATDGSGNEYEAADDLEVVGDLDDDTSDSVVLAPVAAE
jgi:hypothetical protein